MRYISFTVLRAAFVCYSIVGLTNIAFAEIVSGKVLSPAGRPLAGAVVVGQYPPDLSAGLLWPRETAPVKTDADGAFQLEVDTTVVSRPPGPNQPVLKPRLVAGIAGFAPVGITIKPGEVQEIRLRPASTLRGVVHDGNNKPLAGVRVRVAAIGTEGGKAETILFISNALADHYTATSDAQGKYTIPDVPTIGNAFILLTDTRYGMTFASATLKTGNSDASVLVARPGGILTGIILLPDGKPAVGVRVWANGNNGPSSPFVEFKTDATGTYKISGLAQGSFTVQTDTGQVYPKLKATQLANQTVTAGKTTTAPVLKLSAAATVTGLVTDAETNQPLAGVTVVVGQDVGVSDAEGRYQISAMAGSQDIRVVGAPEGYIATARAVATLTGGVAHTQDFALKRGVIVNGVVRGPDARPVPNLNIGLRSGEVFLTTTTDAQGRFTIAGIERGKATVLLQTDLWELEGAKEFDVPTPQRLILTVKKSNVLQITGRVLDPAGKPLIGRRIRVLLEAKEGNPDNFYSVETDSTGQFTINSRAPFERAKVTPIESGYRLLRGGELKQGPNGKLIFEDMIVSAPTRKRTGRVVDAKGKPVPGALTVAAEGGRNSLAFTDAQGNFTLSDLPEGEIQIFAGYRAGYMGATVSTGDKTAPTLTLTPAAAPTPPNLSAAIARWESLWNEGKISNNLPRTFAVQSMAFFDPDRAAKLDVIPDTPTDFTIEVIADTLTKADPARAIAWILPRLSGIRDANVRRNVDYRLAKAAFQTARTNDAFMLYGSLKVDYEEMLAKGGKPDGNTLARLAGLAAYAKDPEAEALARRALETLQSEMERRGDEKEEAVEVSSMIVFGEIGDANPRLVETLSRDLPKHQRARSLFNAILQCHRANLTIAQSLLPLLQQSDDQGGSMYGRAARAVVSVLAARNRTEALALARSISHPSEKALALATCATQITIPAERTALFREAFDSIASPTNRSTDLGVAARIAAMVYPLDVPLGTKLFAEARSGLSSQWGGDNRDSIVRFAFYYARVNRAESRALLEAEWTRRKALLEPDYGSLTAIPLAMAAAEMERANEMADALPTTNNQEFERFMVRCKIAQYLAFPSAVRRTLPFEIWSRSPIWQPGMLEE